MILIIGAMATETNKIKTLIKNQTWAIVASKEVIYGQINQKNVCLITTGVGKTNAAMALASILSTKPIEAIINVGLVGGFKPLKQDEIVIVDSATYHDFDLSIFGYEKGQVPQMPAQYKSNPELLSLASSKFNVDHVKLYTGDTFMTKTINEKAICDMEGASLYQVAYQFNVPMISIKLVSDVIGDQSQIEDYEAFESQASERFKTIISQLI